MAPHLGQSLTVPVVGLMTLIVSPNLADGMAEGLFYEVPFAAGEPLSPGVHRGQDEPREAGRPSEVEVVEARLHAAARRDDGEVVEVRAVHLIVEPVDAQRRSTARAGQPLEVHALVDEHHVGVSLDLAHDGPRR